MERRSISLAYAEAHDKAMLAKMADDANFAGIWTAGESIAVYGAMAAVTSRATIGTGVIRAFATDPRTLANDTFAMQDLTGGRFILGLGGGTKRHNIRQLGKEFDHPATRIKELIRFMRLAWDTPAGKPVNFNGNYVQVEGTRLTGRRNREVERLPIYIAAVNKAMFRMAGEVCDGLCGHPIASVRFIKEVAWPSIDEGLQRAGRTRADFDHGSWIVTAISNDRQQALRELKYHIGRFMATRSYAIVLDSQGLESVRLAVQDAFFNHPNDVDKLVAAIPDDVAAAHGIYGTIDDVRDQAKRYVDVLDTPVFYCASAAMERDRILENIKYMIEAFGQ
jgi:alkanesulfonate monooxygenase SsuD/methylene tetrahydromethanopterin reductase-like flavin-dependent oxidoreductase (luciferase family)